MTSPKRPFPAVILLVASVQAHASPPARGGNTLHPRDPDVGDRSSGVETVRPWVNALTARAVGIALLAALVLSVVCGNPSVAATRPTDTLGVTLAESTPTVQQPGDLITSVARVGAGGPSEVVQRIGRHGAGDRVTPVVLRPGGHGRSRQSRVTSVAQLAAGAAAGHPVLDPKPPAPGTPPLRRTPPTSSPLGIGFAGGTVPVRLHMDVYRTCLAVAPANWVIYGSRPEGDGLDMMTTDRSMAAGYLIVGIPGLLVRTRPQVYATPELYLHNILSAGGRFPVAYGQAMRDAAFGYTWLPFEFPEDYRGGVFYRVWPMPADPGGYILLYRRVQTFKPLWERQGAQAISVALSIRCTRQLRPSPDVAGRGGSDDDRAETTYNQQLGMEYAHDPVTGDNYWVSPSTDWDETGPQGPGYYTRIGNERRKLVPGRH